MKKSITIFGAIIALNTAQLVAQDSPAFQRPTPGPERARLSFLVGKFATETHLMASPMSDTGSIGRGTSNISYGVDSMFLFLDDQSINPLLGNYRAHGVLGYDRLEGKYFLSMYNNFGDAPQYKGSMSGDTLTLASKVNFPGGAFDQKLVWYNEGKTNRLKIYNDMGDGYTLIIDQIFTRAGGDAKK